jgi:hypothetical protein
LGGPRSLAHLSPISGNTKYDYIVTLYFYLSPPLSPGGDCTALNYNFLFYRRFYCARKCRPAPQYPKKNNQYRSNLHRLHKETVRFVLKKQKRDTRDVTAPRWFDDGGATGGPPLREEFAGLSFTNVLGICEFFKKNVIPFENIQGVFEMRAQILTTSYWLHVELRKHI